MGNGLLALSNLDGQEMVGDDVTFVATSCKAESTTYILNIANVTEIFGWTPTQTGDFTHL